MRFQPIPMIDQQTILEDPLHRRIRMHAERLSLSDPATGIDNFKTYMQQENELLERYHRQGQGGIRVARSRSMVLDILLENLVARSLAKDDTAEFTEDFAVIALGGYGREEMCPYSDVDIMFFFSSDLSSSRIVKLQKVMTGSVLYPLWDLGFKVGHSSRTMKQAIEEASSNVESKNALLEARLVVGPQTLWDKFRKTYREFIRKGRMAAYFNDRLADEKKRHDKYGNTVFLQEPDIKNGVGGLRDYQNAIWMAMLQLGIDSVHDLGDMGFLNTDEKQEFASAYDFLLRVRTELHLQSSHPTDLLDLEKQTQVAWYLGYHYRDITRRVEFFMGDYYRNCESINRIASYINYKIARLSHTGKSLREIFESHRKVTPSDGFVIRSGTIQPVNENVFKEDPERLIRVFRHAQQSNVAIDLDLQRTIRQSAGLIDKNVINSPTANRAFLTILQQPGNVFPTLNLMNSCGILQEFIPEWKNMRCLVQHEFYHRFTADYHTLNTIRELDYIFTFPDDPMGASYLHVLRDTSCPTLPYLALLLHDIGKGLGIKGHAHRGALLAKEILSRLGYNPELSAKIIDIVEHHLDMARFWQRYDIEDPRTAQSFAKVITDEETLRYLYVLTYCDAKGTSSDLWNGYKNMLHGQLFKATQSILAGKRTTYSAEDMIPKHLVKEKLPDISDEEIEAHYNMLPERYFIYNNADEVVLHIRMVNELLKRIAEADSLSTLIPIVHWQNDQNLSLTVVNIVTWDRSGLFYKLAGAFSVAGLSIVSSKAVTRADHITVDTFYVCDSSGGIVQNDKAHAIVEKYLKKTLLNNEDLLPAIREQESKRTSSAWLHQAADHVRTPIAPVVGVYHELSLKHTIIEIQCEDRIGLLYMLSKAIFDHGFDISFARISTERSVAMDTFYIEQMDNSTTDSGELLALRENLAAIVGRKSTDEKLRKIAQ
jgi:[protein-PII] uridylyltransferase